jgi:hypothetical protein
MQSPIVLETLKGLISRCKSQKLASAFSAKKGGVCFDMAYATKKDIYLTK